MRARPCVGLSLAQQSWSWVHAWLICCMSSSQSDLPIPPIWLKYRQNPEWCYIYKIMIRPQIVQACWHVLLFLHLRGSVHLPFVSVFLFTLYQNIYLLLCQPACLLVFVHPPARLSVYPSTCLSVLSVSELQLQLIQHRGQLHWARLPLAELQRQLVPPKMWCFCGQDYVDLTMSSV